MFVLVHRTFFCLLPIRSCLKLEISCRWCLLRELQTSIWLDAQRTRNMNRRTNEFWRSKEEEKSYSNKRTTNKNRAPTSYKHARVHRRKKEREINSDDRILYTQWSILWTFSWKFAVNKAHWDSSMIEERSPTHHRHAKIKTKKNENVKSDTTAKNQALMIRKR